MRTETSTNEEETRKIRASDDERVKQKYRYEGKRAQTLSYHSVRRYIKQFTCLILDPKHPIFQHKVYTF